jgi:hypothetical protein
MSSECYFHDNLSGALKEETGFALTSNNHPSQAPKLRIFAHQSSRESNPLKDKYFAKSSAVS